MLFEIEYTCCLECERTKYFYSDDAGRTIFIDFFFFFETKIVISVIRI